MRIGIIVDNPQRDLAGCVVLAKELTKKNVKTILIPGNLRSYEIGKIKPQYVLLPNLRWPYIKLAKFLKKNGVKVGVIESEGGFTDNIFDLLQTYDKKFDYKNLVDDWFFWGPKFQKSFIKHLNLPKENCHIVGNPKFDLYELSKPKITKEQILIATGFPFYNNLLGKNETWKSERKHNISEDDLIRDYANQERQYLETIEFIKNIIEIYSNHKFVVRPHPFENLENYTKEISNHNVFIENNEPSHQVLQKSSLLIHFVSSLVYEASLYKLNNIAIKTLIPENTINSNNPLLKLTKFVDSKKELIENLEKYIFPRDYSNIYMGDYVFTHRESSSSNLIASVIYKSEINSINKKEINKLSYGFVDGEHFTFLKYSIRRTFNIKLKYRLNFQNRITAWKNSFKYFSLSDVSVILNDLGSDLEIDYFDNEKISVGFTNEK